MVYTNLIFLVDSFLKTSNEVQLEKPQDITHKDTRSKNKTVIDLLHTRSRDIIDPRVGDKLSEIHQSQHNYSFSIHTATPNSFHLYRKIQQYIKQILPTKHIKDNGERLMIFYYQDHAIILAMNGKEIKMQVISTHSIENQHTKTIDL